MTRSLQLILSLLILVTIQSCFKEDKAIPYHPRGDVKTDTIGMTDTYLYQVFFSLDSGEVIKTVVKTTYDLGFECSTSGWHVLLNTSNFMKAADLGVVPFGVKHDTTGTTLRFDKSDGNPDSTAVGNWFTVSGSDTVSNNHVYAVSRGLDEFGNPLGVYQVIFDSLKRGTYYFRYTLLSGGAAKSGAVHKAPGVNYAWFSFSVEATIDVEPLPASYDLLFTQYTTLLYTDQGIPYPYLVTGVLSNRNGVEVAFDTLHAFSSITRSIADGLTYSANIDEIGYFWKYYNFNTGAYTISPKNCYIIHTVSGLFYKLRFIGFYNKNGSKGYPSFEYEKL